MRRGKRGNLTDPSDDFTISALTEAAQALQKARLQLENLMRWRGYLQRYYGTQIIECAANAERESIRCFCLCHMLKAQGAEPDEPK
jgi:hypothetical protein